MVSPIISNMMVTKVLVDNGAGLNLLSARLVEKLQVPVEQLKPTDPFRGVNPGIVRPLGRITLPVTFGSREAFRTEHIVFDVAHTPLPYKGILGRPALIKFMAATHCAYGVMKMPSVYGVLSVRCDLKDVAWWVGEVVRAAAAVDVGDEDDAGDEGSPGNGPATKKARAAPQELAGGSAGSSSCPGKGQKLWEEVTKVKKLPLQAGNKERTVTVGANLAAE